MVNLLAILVNWEEISTCRSTFLTTISELTVSKEYTVFSNKITENERCRPIVFIITVVLKFDLLKLYMYYTNYSYNESIITKQPNEV